MKKTLFIIPLTFTGITLVACGGGNKPGPEPTGEYNLTFNSNTLTVSSTALQEEKDFEATVKMNEGLISKYDMPVTLGNIQVQGGEDIKYTDYTYEINSDKESAKIVIPGQYITNNLTITADAKLVQHKLIFSKSEAFRVTKPTVGKNQSLDTDIFVKDYWKDYVTLPATLDIKIGGKDLIPGADFEYKVITEGEKAHLKIDASLITDDIVVASQVLPADYDVKFKDAVETTHLKINHDKATVATDFNATLSVTDDKYVLPSDNDITITCKDAQSGVTYTIPKTSGYYYSPHSGALTIYHRCVYGPITIEAAAEQVTAILEVKTSTDETKLQFYSDPNFNTEITAPIKIVEQLGEGYSIYVKSTNDDYIVPSTFDITVDGEKVIGYSVKYGGIPSPIKGDKRYATLTIQKDCVKGYVVVYGVGQVESRHVVKAVTAYLETTKLPEYISAAQKLECTFTPKDGHNYPLAENVNVKIADVWYDGNGYNDEGDHIGITYDSNTGKLVISEQAVGLAFKKEGSDIEIIAKPEDVSILKELTSGSHKEWETLHALSMYGYKLFTPGETTGDFYLDGCDYPFQARLIGFAQERGSTDTGYVQGLTLEFTTAISQEQYYQDKKANNIYYKKDFAGIFESNLYSVLNDADEGIINRLPLGLKNNLYQVTKYGLTSDGENKLNSLNYLYPLSLSEMNEKVITTDLNNKYLKESANSKDEVYHYYKQFTTAEELKAARIKGYQGSSASAYWLRTPDLEANNKDFNITINGSTTTNAQTTKGVAPAFCI